MAAQTNFIDIATIWLHAGKGGDGAVSFHREKFVAAGGPDGGDGGRGGDIIFVADDHLSTLMDFRYKRKYTAPEGGKGGASLCHGKNAENLIIKVPRGTVVRDLETNEIIKDMSDSDDFVLCKGGRGGWGNQHFATPTRQVPRFAKAGLPGESHDVVLELKLLADVGLIGFPNVGKSTLLNRLLNEERAMVSEIAGTTRDVIEECANIGGVLFRFLDTAGIRPTDDRLEQMGIQRTMSSIERARIVIHMVDASTLTGPVPAPDFPLRPGQKLLTVVNKTDKAPAAWRLPEGVVGISAKHGEGIDALCDALRESVDTEALYHGDPVVSNSRHYEALSAAREALGQALDGLAHGLPTDLLSEEIRQVITHLGAITGRGAIAPDEILQNIFSKFCIGK